MLGNRTGWILAAVIVALECVAVVYALSFDSYTDPTTLATSPSSMSPIQAPTPPSFVLKTSGSASATTIYRAAINEYLANVSDYEAMVRDSDRSRIAKLPAIDKIVAAASAPGDALFADHLDEVIDYGEPNALQALDQLGLATYKAGVLQGKRAADRIRAIEYYQAVFILGYRMSRERLTWREYDAGVTLASTAGAALVAELNRLPDRAADAAALQTFLDAQREQRQALLDVFQAIYTNNEQKIATHAGDVFVFAEDSREPMWRVEAILKLGRMRFNVGVPPVPGTQRHATRLLRKYVKSEDPIIRRAAEVATALTAEQFRTLR